MAKYDSVVGTQTISSSGNNNSSSGGSSGSSSNSNSGGGGKGSSGSSSGSSSSSNSGGGGKGSSSSNKKETTVPAVQTSPSPDTNTVNISQNPTGMFSDPVPEVAPQTEPWTILSGPTETQEPSIEQFYDDVTDPNVDVVEAAIDETLGTGNNAPSNQALNDPTYYEPDWVAPMDLPEEMQSVPVAVQPVVEQPSGNSNPVVADPVAAPVSDPVSANSAIPTEQDAWLAAQGAMGVDATARRRRRAGYQGTILTGMGGQQETNLGRTSLLGG